MQVAVANPSHDSLQISDKAKSCLDTSTSHGQRGLIPFVRSRGVCCEMSKVGAKCQSDQYRARHSVELADASEVWSS